MAVLFLQSDSRGFFPFLSTGVFTLAMRCPGVSRLKALVLVGAPKVSPRAMI